MILDKKLILKNYINRNVSFSFFIDKLVKQKKVNFYYNDTGYLSISDLKRYNKTKEYFSTNFILVDRDGVLNLKNDKHYYVRNLRELKNELFFYGKIKKNC